MAREHEATCWVAVGLSSDGTIVGICGLKTVSGASLQETLRLEPLKALVSVKRRSLLVTPLNGVLHQKKPAVQPVTSWREPEFHAYWQQRFREHRSAGYPALSHKDRSNWEMLLGGFQKPELVELVDFTLKHYPSLVEALRLPVAPSVGVLRGWAPSIAAALKDPPKPKPQVREWGTQPCLGRKF